jgi:putative flippase GtrA
MIYFIRYNIIGIVNTLTGYSIIYFCMYAMDMGPEKSNFIGYTIGLIVSYLLNKKFNFRTSTSVYKEMPVFLAVFAVCYVCNLMTLRMAIHLLESNPYVAQLLAGVVYTIMSFLLYKYLVFRQTPT